MKFTVKSFLIGVASVLGIVGFCMMFMAPLAINVSDLPNDLRRILELLLGENWTQFEWEKFYFGTEEIKGHILPMIGFVLMLIGGLGAFALSFIAKKPKVQLPVLILSVLIGAVLAVGGILTVCTKAIYIADLTSELDYAQEKLTEVLNDAIKLGAGPLVGGVLGLSGGVLTILGGLLPGPKKVKKK